MLLMRASCHEGACQRLFCPVLPSVAMRGFVRCRGVQFATRVNAVPLRLFQTLPASINHEKWSEVMLEGGRWGRWYAPGGRCTGESVKI